MNYTTMLAHKQHL